MSVSHRVISVSSAALLFAGIGVAHSSGPTPKRPAQSDPAQRQPDIDWPAYNGNINGQHYSALSLINRSNVSELKVAWQYDTGEKGNLETNPLIVGRVLFGYTYSGKVIALDGATGALLWTFDSGAKNSQPSRGFAWWTDGKNARLFAGVLNYLYALDPATGKPIPGFGEEGRIDLRKGLRGDYTQQSVALTTPGIVYENLIIVGGRNPETEPCSSRRHPRLRCPHRHAALDLPHHPASRRIRLRHLAARRLEDRRRSQQLGRHVARRPARHRLRAHRLARSSIFTAAIASATTSSPTRCSPSTPRPASVSGISRASITTSGTAISPRRPRSFTVEARRQAASTPWRRPPSRASSTSSIASPARRSSPSRNMPTRPATCPAKKPRPPSPCPLRPRPSRASA